VTVGLAEVEAGVSPRRIHLLQYTVSALVSGESWARASAFSVQSFETLLVAARSALSDFPGLAEPFALVSPKAARGNGGTIWLDSRDHVLPVTGEGDPSVSVALHAVVGDRLPIWIAGRLVGEAGGIRIFPVSAAMDQRGTVLFRRIA
jgi:hypothetical protein